MGLENMNDALSRLRLCIREHRDEPVGEFRTDHALRITRPSTAGRDTDNTKSTGKQHRLETLSKRCLSFNRLVRVHRGRGAPVRGTKRTEAGRVEFVGFRCEELVPARLLVSATVAAPCTLVWPGRYSAGSKTQ